MPVTPVHLGVGLFGKGLLPGQVSLTAFDLREASVLPALVGGLLGGLTHPVLDAVMHDDVAPLGLFSVANPFHGAVPYSKLTTLLSIAACVGSALTSLHAARLWRIRWQAAARSAEENVE